MPLGSGKAVASDVAGIGAYFDSLLQDPSWVLRRVETIRILDDARVERSVTLDIDVPAVLARPGSKQARDGARLPIPIAILKKDLLFELDVRGSAGEAIHVGVSDADSRAAHAVLLKRLADLGLPKGSLTTSASDELFHLARYPSGEDVLALIRLAFPEERPADVWFPIDRVVEDRWAASPNLAFWRTALDDFDFFQSISTLARNYMLLGEVDASAQTEILKMRHVEPSLVFVKPFSLPHLALAPLPVLLQVPGVGSAQREHVRLVAPTGATVHDVELLVAGRPVSEADYAKRVSLERGIIYTRALPRGDYELSAKLNMRRGSLLLPAMISTAFAFFLLLFGTILEVSDSRLSSGDADADAAVTILALLPTLSSIYFIQPGEHDLVRGILAVPRILVVVSSLASILVAAGVAASVSADSLRLLLAIALVASGVTVLLLGAALIRLSAQRQATQSSGVPI